MLLIIILLGACAVFCCIGFVLGYFFGRRNKARDQQVGFPVLHTGDKPDAKVP